MEINYENDIMNVDYGIKLCTTIAQKINNNRGPI